MISAEKNGIKTREVNVIRIWQFKKEGLKILDR